MAENNGNGDQRVTNAVIKKDIEYLIKEVKQFHDDDMQWRESHDQRMRTLETFRDSATVQIANLQRADEEICEDIDDLRGKTVARDTLAYISAMVTGALAYVFGNK